MTFMSFAGNSVAGECLLERSTLFCQRAPFKGYRPALTDESVKIWILDVSKELIGALMQSGELSMKVRKSQQHLLCSPAQMFIFQNEVQLMF